MIGLLRATQRTARLGWHLTAGFVQAARLRSKLGGHWQQSPRGQAAISRWMRRLARIFGLRVAVTSSPLPVATMIVANHISWLDVIAIASVRPAHFLAKDEVRHWPIIGPLAIRYGTRFIHRNRLSTLHESIRQLCHTLRIRQHVAIFPEGTTSDGNGVGHFHPALFEAARRAYCPIQPLAIRYRHGGDRDNIAPYTGDDNFIWHLWQILKRRETCVELHFLPPLSSREPRRQLAQKSRALILSALAARHPLPHRRLPRIFHKFA